MAFFSGFVAGDGSFIVRPNNAGSTWCCELQVKLRADDTPLLVTFRDWFAAGELFATPARGKAHPQTAWIVGRKADCARVAELLGRSAPLGKAARQFDVWRRAVASWVTAGGASPDLALAAEELRSLHRSAVPVPCGVDIRRAHLLAFLGGFAAAEAHFGATRQGSPRFDMRLRADDGPLLQCFRDRLGIGTLGQVPPSGGSQAAVSWRVTRLCHLTALVEAMDSAPPRGRAGYVYEAWRELVLLAPHTSARRAALAAEIGRRRKYRAELRTFPATTACDRSRLRCLHALNDWAESRSEPGSALDYARWRRDAQPQAPTRNTVARVFGSWAQALEAAGISCERARSADQVAAIRAGGAARREARHAELRELVVAAVRRCTAEIGREPRAMEFLRWRHQDHGRCPSTMTIYRVFPGGFGEVLAAARD